MIRPLAALFLSDSSPFGVYVGANAFSGKAVGYGICLGSPIHAATLAYFCQLLTPPCCLQTVIPHTITGFLQSVDCAATLVPSTGGTAIWNPQLFTASESAIYGDPYVYYFYGKELCRRYKPDRLSLRLLSRLNRRAPTYLVLDIDDFCGLNPVYNHFWHNDWIHYQGI